MAVNKHSAAMRSIVDSMNSEANKSIVSHVKMIRNGVEAIDELAANRSPLDTEAAHFQKVSRNANNLRKKAEAAKKAVQESMRQSLIKLDENMVSKTNLIEGKYASEIRQVFKSLDHPERSKALNQAIANKESEVIAAVVKAPSILSGFSDDELSRYRSDYEKLVVPEYVEQRDEILNTERLAALALNSAISASNDYIDLERADEIERLEGLSLAAENAFKESFKDE